MSNPFEAAFEHQQQPQNPIEVIEHQIADTNAKADNLNGRVGALEARPDLSARVAALETELGSVVARVVALETWRKG